jgi:hypothetical protein
MEEPAQRARAKRRRARLTLFGLPIVLALWLGVCQSAGASAHSSLGAAQLFRSALKSSSAASSFAVKGTVDQPKDDLALNLQVSASGTAQGTLTINGGTVRIIEIGNTAYFNADTTFWTQNASATAAQLLAGKWVYGPISSDPFSSFKQFLSPSAFMKLFLGSDQGPFSKGGATTVNGTRVIPVHADGPGTLYVKASNPHLVVSAKGSQGTTSASLSFSNYGKTVHPATPAGGISLQALENSGS